MKLLFLRLSSIRDTAASSTHRVLADLALAAEPDTEIDFAFLPPKRTPRVSGIFSNRDWSDFDLILATNSFVLEALNLPWLLHACGQSPWADERPEDFPPILLGGSNALAAQCLARPNGIAVPDAFFFGEAEASLPCFLRCWRIADGNKHGRLAAATAGLDGFWVTGSLPENPVRQAVARGRPVPASPQPLLDVETADTVRLTVSTGCASFCAFCFEGYERKPYREFALDDALAQARRLKTVRGARTVEIDAFNLNTYAALAPLVERCARLFDTVAFKSQRVDGIAACPQIVDLERAAGKSSYTLGIEGISARMRAFLCKSLSDANIATAIRALLDRRVRELKLFFILTAHETSEDLAAFGDFCARLRGWLNMPGTCTRVVLSFGRLVRMPNTPLAHDRIFLDEAEWRFCVDGVAAACRRNRLENRFALGWPDYLATQLLAACGHEHAEGAVRLACEGLSCHGPLSGHEAALLAAAIPGPEPDPESRFAFVQRPVSVEHLRRRWDDAQTFLDAGYCLGGTCAACGACSNADERRALTEHPRAPVISDAAIQSVARIEADKRRLAPLYRRVLLPTDFAGHTREWVGARLMQYLLTRHPALADTLLAADEALFSLGDAAEHLAVPAGATVVRFRAWENAPLLAALAKECNLFPDKPLPSAFAPGTFARAEWQLATAAVPRAAAQLVASWLNAQRLPHTLLRDGEAWRFDLAPAAAQKKTVFSTSVEPLGDGARICIVFAPKADLRALLGRLPSHAPHPHAACVRLDV